MLKIASKNTAIAILFSAIFCSNVAIASDPLVSAVELSSSALKAHSERLKIIAQNIANEDSTALTPGADPYRRKTIHFRPKFDKKLGASKVVVTKYDHDKSDFKKVYDPSHPAADQNGIVLYPNVNKIIESRDAQEAQRSYEANLGLIEVSKSMIEKTLEIIR